MIFHKSRPIEEQSKIMEILERCKVAKIAFNQSDFPYIVPMNYGAEIEDDKIVIYLHGAKKGRKMDCIRENTRAGFSAEWFHEKPSAKVHCDLEYESVIGGGEIRIIDEDQDMCVKGMNCILKHYQKPLIKKYTPQFFEHFSMIKLTLIDYTGKQLYR